MVKPLQSEKTGTSMGSGRVDLVCGVCINNEEWLKPLQSKTGTSIFKSWEWTSCVEFVLTTRNGETSVIGKTGTSVISKNWAKSGRVDLVCGSLY
ncbi:hypothetical protein CEXT_546961 [Caerostris extrusa]|uniref:Uncharacterized protein n=1 Tax=Caerostris extrusa TaxID=172846 RepID=A0AAV4VI02_CAEEX|nr:hypothetical protein CEXT_546961 [Caerostris extrusa]